MKKKDLYTLTVALLGILVGVLLAVTVGQIRSSRKMKVSADGWQKLDLILRTVSQEYVDSIDYKKVTEAAISEALASLDPHSVYMPPVELEASETELAGNFEGIGIQFNVPNDTAIVLEVIPGGPAEKVGMQQGDRLLKVDETVIAGVKFPQDSMVRRMKGPSGTKVTITVSRDGVEIPFEISRGKIPVHSVDAAFMIDDTTGYIRLSKFAKNTAREFLESTETLLRSGMKHLIFDLRDNTGGYLDQALALSQMFLDKGQTIVYTEGLHSPREDYKAHKAGFMRKTRLSVLINEGSASSSEIFAGAMQDNDRGLIVGRRSFGKGLVQKPYFFSDGSGMRLTVARFHTPSGRCIQKPYDEDYQYDIYRRYQKGEMYDADSIKVNKDEEYLTLKGRKVYGGGGIVPDVFVPVDTTKVTDYYMKVRSKATAMRFASDYFDTHKSELTGIDNFSRLLQYLDAARLDQAFRQFASSHDGIKPADEKEWEQTAPYLMTQVRALVGRYSKLGDEAYYHLFLDYDTVIEEALKPHSID